MRLNGLIYEMVVARLERRERCDLYVRRWHDGVIHDVAEAVDSPRRIVDDPVLAQRVLDLVPAVPTPVWGRDELKTGDMWNSNSVVSWLLTRSDVDAEAILPPTGGRAPGWRAGVIVARRQIQANGRGRVDPST